MNTAFTHPPSDIMSSHAMSATSEVVSFFQKKYSSFFHPRKHPGGLFLIFLKLEGSSLLHITTAFVNKSFVTGTISNPSEIGCSHPQTHKLKQFIKTTSSQLLFSALKLIEHVVLRRSWSSFINLGDPIKFVS